MPWDIVVLLVFFAFPLVRRSLLLRKRPPDDRIMGDARALQLAAHETAGLLLFGGLVWHQRRTRDFAFHWKDFGRAFMVYLAQYAAYLAGFQVLSRLKLVQVPAVTRRRSKGRKGMGKPLLMVVNPVFEEFLFRYYLPTRTEQCFVQKWHAHLLSVFVQFAYHTYQGVANAGLVGLMFLVAAGYFYRSRRIWPVILAHAAFDWMAYFYAHSAAKLQGSEHEDGA